MDLIHEDSNHAMLGAIDRYELDLAFGSDENDFECTMAISDHCCSIGDYLAMQDVVNGHVKYTEYGGRIDGVSVDTGNETVTYSGRTWHGILAKKILCPDDGQDYLVLSGDANEVLGFLIQRTGLGDLFEASDQKAGIAITSYQMDRYIDAYTGIRKMLKCAGAKLAMYYRDGKVYLSAVPLVDYSQDEEWDSDQMNFQISSNEWPVNHLICLGKGDLSERMVRHLHMDAQGNISGRQTFFGENEVAETYDYSSVESEDELISGGTQRLQEAYATANTLETDFQNNAEYDVGDVVGARETITGVTVKRDIVKKILKVNSSGIRVECQIGE